MCGALMAEDPSTRRWGACRESGGTAVGVRLRVGVCGAVVARQVRDVVEVVEVTVAVVGTLVGCVPGEAFQLRVDDPVRPDNGPPLTVSINVTG